jgi:Na+/melibiose symporter-like transporter
MNMPVIALALVLQSRLAYREDLERQRLAIDWLGVALLILLFVQLTVSFNLARSPGLYFAASLIATALFAAATVRRLLSSPAPVVEWRLFRSPSFAAATLDVLSSNFVMYAMLLTVPFFVQEVLGRGASMSGIALGAMSVAMALLSPLSGRMGDALGRRLPAVLGAVATSAGAALLLLSLSNDVPTWQLAAGLAVLGLGVGLGTGAATTAAIESAPKAWAGAAAGANSMMRYVGSIAATGLVGAILSAERGIDDQIGVYRLAWAVLVVVALASVVAASRIHRFAEA